MLNCFRKAYVLFDFHLKNLRDLEDEYFMHEEVFKNYEELVTESSVTIFKVKNLFLNLIQD